MEQIKLRMFLHKQRSIKTNLEETTFQPDSSLKNQLQSNAVKANLTKVNPNFGRPDSLQDFYISKGYPI